MLAVPWPRPFSDDEWTFELKWDGVRGLLCWDGDSARLTTRSGNDVIARYPEVAGMQAARPVVLDGEIVAIDDEGRSSFERLQARIHLSSPMQVADAAERVPINYVVFDLLADGEDVTGAPIEERRARLHALDLSAPIVEGSVVAGDAAGLWQSVIDRSLEGIVAKRARSRYRSGVRSSDWRKITRLRRARAVIGGFTAGRRGRRDTFIALQLGLWDGPDLRWIGAVGAGFDERSLRTIRSALDQMILGWCPFVEEPELPLDTVWVHPRLVALVQYTEWTASGRLRAAWFKGITDDPPDAASWTDEGP